MILAVLLIAHFLADFTFQPSGLAQAKLKKQRWLLLHSGIYAVCVSAACFVCVKASVAVVPALLLSVSHFLIDEMKCALEKKRLKKAALFAAFLVDQALHIAVIALCWLLFALEAFPSGLWRLAGEWTYLRVLVIYALIFVLIWDPACVFVRKLFDDLSGSAGREAFTDEPRAGRIIGKLERLIIAVLVLSNQLAGIGFVLTAKSIARFKQFEEQGFAERYLVGTLTSVTFAMITALVLKSLL